MTGQDEAFFTIIAVKYFGVSYQLVQLLGGLHVYVKEAC